MTSRGLAGTACRLAIIVGAAVSALASSSSSSNQPATMPAAYGDQQAPPPQSMDPARAVGLWKSSFGPVKIENDPQGGPGAVRGVWVYDKNGAQVIGSFGGVLEGNVLQFTWEEPGQPVNLVGEGYIAFDPEGRGFNGKWWTSNRDRGGEWQGWRPEGAEAAPGGPAEQGPNDGVPGPAEQAPPPDPGPPQPESI